jgi:hypothetical protein
VRLWSGLILVFGLTALSTAAEEIAPIGIVRGALIECDATQLAVRTADNHTYRFVIDSKTFIERDSFRISCSKIDKAEALEIVSDRSGEPGMRYARLITVVNPEIRARRRALMAARAPLLYEDPTLSIAPRGSLTFTGVVLRVDDDGLVLRTRVDGEKWILVRRDTRYREDGLRVEPSSLHSSTRVFVRAGTNLDGLIEAYEIVWGEILTPAAAH